MKQRPETHHQKILEQVRGNILSGTWPPGHRIPFENDMARDFGVSRMTVNKVLTQLTREGFLERRRKLGTLVSVPRVQSAVMEIADIKNEVLGAGQVHSYAQISRDVRPASAAECARLQMPDTVLRLLHLQGLHSADGVPYCLEQRLINLGAVPEAEGTSFETEPAGTWLLRQVPWSSAQHTIRAVAIAAADAKWLRLPSGTACLEIERLTQFNGQAITLARLCYPGDRHQLVARFLPRLP
jgi:GntR family histidine utilization transcriptional repressor